ncbi:MAG: ribonuclease P protein component [Oscillospiraceae bacterium]|nr:ribonuclease P protein component [Oscillospiraceae bacterium]
MDSRFTLKQNSDFRRLYAKGKSSANRFLVLYCRRNGRGVNRMGYTVSSKLGGAVVRNRVRRRLREIARLNAPALKTGWDLVVVARMRAADAPYAELDRAYRDACAALGLLREEET